MYFFANYLGQLVLHIGGSNYGMDVCPLYWSQKMLPNNMQMDKKKKNSTNNTPPLYNINHDILKETL